MLRLIQILLRSSLVILEVNVIYFYRMSLIRYSKLYVINFQSVAIFIFHFNLETFWYVLLGFLVAALLGFLLGFVVYRISLYLQRLGKWIWFGSVKGRVL